MEAAQSFKKLLGRLTPATSNNEQCISLVRAYEGDLKVLLKTLIDEMGRSSLNGRAKILNFIEHGAGIVGKYDAPKEWNDLIAQNLQKFVDAAVPVQFAPASLVNIDPAKRCVQGFHKAGLIDETTAERMIAQVDSKKQTIETLSSTRQGKYSHQVTREEVLRRMEDDRERAKKYKERELSVETGSQDEFDRLWDTVGPPTSTDLTLVKEFNALAGL